MLELVKVMVQDIFSNSTISPNSVQMLTSSTDPTKWHYQGNNTIMQSATNPWPLTALAPFLHISLQGLLSSPCRVYKDALSLPPSPFPHSLFILLFHPIIPL